MSALVVERVGPGATVQDLGRPGWMHQGVPRGGPLDRALFARTQRSLGNAEGCAAIELPWHGARFRAHGAVIVSVDGVVSALDDSARFDVPAASYAVRYVGVRGGVDVPRALGSRGTLLAAALGGLDGRMLRKGDALVAGDEVAGEASACDGEVDTARSVRVTQGPDAFEGASIARLLASEFAVSDLVDRVGMRLRGEPIAPPGDAAGRSAPMVCGAIEVTPDGGLIVLGPDHPTTGGYPVIAVVALDDLGSLAQRRPGARVRFTLR